MGISPRLPRAPRLYINRRYASALSLSLFLPVLLLSLGIWTGHLPRSRLYRGLTRHDARTSKCENIIRRRAGDLPVRGSGPLTNNPGRGGSRLAAARSIPLSPDNELARPI